MEHLDTIVVDQLQTGPIKGILLGFVVSTCKPCHDATIKSWNPLTVPTLIGWGSGEG